MNWRDTLRRVTLADGRRLVGASFRRVPFLVDSTDRTGGRRIVTHEFPLRDDPFVEDLGRKARVFSVEGYVLGPDYVAQRDALLAALEDKSGPGELVHPSHGVRSAVCSSLATRESLNSDGGMARFTIEFIEAPAQAVEPTSEADLPGEAQAGADTAQATVTADLVTTFDVAGLPSWALTSAQTAIKAAADALDAKLKPVIADAQDVAKLDQKLKIITAEAASLARDPALAMARFQDALSTLTSTAEAAPLAVVNALLNAYGFDAGADAPTTTATRVQERANQLALIAALRLALLIAAARAVVTVEFSSVEDATTTRDDVAGKLQDQAASAGDDVYATLVALRSQILLAIPGNTILSRVVTASRPVPVPSLLVAYQLYGSVDQEADVLARNNVRHPGFVAGDLRVLSRHPGLADLKVLRSV